MQLTTAVATTSLLVAFFTAPAFGQSLFVDPLRGNDADGGSADRPVRTITRALALADRGTRPVVNVLPGYYGPAHNGETLPLRIGSGGATHAGLVVRAVDGGVTFDLAGSRTPAIDIGANAFDVRLTDIDFVNGEMLDPSARVVEISATTRGIRIDRCRFESARRGIVVVDVDPASTDIAVHDNVFVDLTGAAIDALEREGVIEVWHNTIVGSSSTPNSLGIHVESPFARVCNNLLVGLREGVVTGASVPPNAVTGNDVWQCQTPFSGSLTTPPPGNLAVDPKFVAPLSGDFRLRADSPLIDAGAPSFGAADFFGNPRDVDGDGDGTPRPDIGAFELATAQLTRTFNPQNGSLVLQMSGPAGNVGAVLFALDDGGLYVPGIGHLLLDPASLLSVATPLSALPQSTILVLPVQLPGVGLRMQGVAIDLARNRATTTNLARAIF